MKTSRILFTAVVVMMVAALIGCSDGSDSGGDEGGPPSLPGKLKLTDVRNFEGRFVGNESEAVELLDSVASSFAGILQNANRDAVSDAFLQTYKMSLWNYLYSRGTDKSLSVSLKINDFKRIMDAAGIGAGTIVGTSKVSYSSNKPLYTYFNSYYNNIYNSGIPPTKGDWLKTSSSYEKTFTLNDFATVSGYYDWYYDYYYNTRKVAGVIKVSGSSSGKTTLKEYNPPLTGNYDKSDVDSKDTYKVSLALSVFDGTKGAKFILTYAEEGNWSERTTKWNGGNSRSSLEVYDNSNTLRYTIRNYNNYTLTQYLASSLFDDIGESYDSDYGDD